MPKITIKDETYLFEEPISLKKLSELFQKDYDSPIVLTFVNHRLLELHHKIRKDSIIQFVTLKDKAGFAAMQRAAILMLIKAFYSVVGQENIESLRVEFSLGDCLYLSGKGDFEITPALLETVKAKMKDYAARKFEIKKHSLTTQEAIELFKDYNMQAKARLFRYRRTGRVNLYSLGHFDDYFYGEMPISADAVKVFDLVVFNEENKGFLLHLPNLSNPSKLQPLNLSNKDKLYVTLMESGKWLETMHVADVGALNDRISQLKANELILIQEALMEKKIAEIAKQIAESPNKRLVMIAGPSSSGKTTFSHRLSTQLTALGLRPHPIEVDDYFVNREFSPRHPDGSYNFESIHCLDIKKFNQDLQALLEGKKVELPRYNFEKGKREYRGDYLQLEKNDILVIEGIHCLNDELTYTLDKDQKFKIYISAMSQLNIDEHNYIPSSDGRLIRRIVRDARSRGMSAQETIRMWPSVRKGEEENIYPFQNNVDVMFNSALVYELSVLKQYVEPLLFQIPEDAPEAYEANRLLKFLDYFLGIDSISIPQNSMLREFIGGSCYNV